MESVEDLKPRTGRRRNSFRAEDVEMPEPKSKGVFVDGAAMKQKMRESMMKPAYDVGNFYKKTGFCQKVARNQIFDNLTLSVIAFNALWMWIDTDLNDSAELLKAHPVFQTAEHFFCAYFSFEWAMRFGAFKRKRDGLQDAWFCFDTFMVSMMVAETWVLTAVMALAADALGGGGLGNASMLRLLRLLRLSRMARMAKLLRSMPELLILVKGMVAAARSVFFTLVLLFIAIYIFAIAFRQLTDGTEVGVKHFNTVIEAMHTLFLDGTLLDATGPLVYDLLDDSWIYVLLLYVFITLAALMIMNMLIGVLCEVVSAVAAAERDSISVATVKEGIMNLINKGGIDTDGDNMISQEEFNAILDDPEATRLLNSVDVDTYALVDLSDFIFEFDDVTQEQTQLSYEEFIDLVLSLRGSNTATVKDMVELRKITLEHLKKMDGKLDQLVCSSNAATPSTRKSHRSSTSSITTCCSELAPGAFERNRPEQQCSQATPAPTESASLQELAERLDSAFADARLQLDSLVAGLFIHTARVPSQQADEVIGVRSLPCDREKKNEEIGKWPRAPQLQRRRTLPSATPKCDRLPPAQINNMIEGTSETFVSGVHRHPDRSSVPDDEGWQEENSSKESVYDIRCNENGKSRRLGGDQGSSSVLSYANDDPDLLECHASGTYLNQEKQAQQQRHGANSHWHDMLQRQATPPGLI